MKRNVFLEVALATLLVLAFSLPPLCKFQCVTCDNAAKTENSQSEDCDEIYLHPWQTISEVWVKAGQGCFQPDGECYNVIDGGIGYSYVKVERIGSGPGCQAISHLEVCYSEDTSTSTPTSTPTATFTFTHEPSETPTATATDPVEETSTPSPTDVEVTPTWTPNPQRTPNTNGKG